jgi:hypothetical protein
MFASRIRWCLVGSVCALAIIFMGASVSARDDKPAAQDAGMAEMEAAAKPGPQHEQLKRQFAGNWDCEITHTWGPQPETTTGTEKAEMVLGGRYVQASFDGKMMGQPFQGAGVMGYDILRKKYFSTWMDSMGTSLMLATGTYDDGTKTYTMTGKMAGPGGVDVPIREVTRIDSDDKHTFEMYMPGPDGKEAKMMTIVYTRRK